MNRSGCAHYPSTICRGRSQPPLRSRLRNLVAVNWRLRRCPGPSAGTCVASSALGLRAARASPTMSNCGARLAASRGAPSALPSVAVRWQPQECGSWRGAGRGDGLVGWLALCMRLQESLGAGGRACGVGGHDYSSGQGVPHVMLPDGRGPAFAPQVTQQLPHGRSEGCSKRRTDDT